jgi:hypothetical protein
LIVGTGPMLFVRPSKLACMLCLQSTSAHERRAKDTCLKEEICMRSYCWRTNTGIQVLVSARSM